MASAPPSDTKTGLLDTYSDPSSSSNYQINYGPPAGYQPYSYNGADPPPSYDASNPAHVQGQGYGSVDGQGYGTVGGQGYGAIAPNMAGYEHQGPQPVLVQPGVVAIPEQPYADVPDYLCLSIVSIFFCLFLGVFSIINSSSARNLKGIGQYQSALVKARTARNLAIIAIVIGSIIITGNIVVLVL